MEIKMAEIFGSEGMKNLHLRGALVLTGPEAEAAVLAVKNHDRLTEENKLLRDLLKGITSEYDDLLEKSIEHVGSHGTSALHQSKILLSETGGE